MQEKKFKISDNAAKRIAFLLTKEPENSKLRISVSAGGCSGFMYQYNFVTDEINTEEDIFIEKLGALVLVDKVSIEFLDDSELDFIENLGGSYFDIKNPNAASKCGCGNSFSL
jgi:iron-sulfur cluster insertion protein